MRLGKFRKFTILNKPIMAIQNPESKNYLSDLLVCSRCHSDMEQTDGMLACIGCQHQFPIIDGIPRLIELTHGELSDDDPIEHRKKYEHRYQSEELAKGYNRSFETISRDKKRTVRELEILQTMFRSMEKCESILDIPCGGGRLSPPLAAKTHHLIEMDASVEQVKLAISVKTHATPRYGTSASALALPLKDATVDATLNARLSHHLPSANEREKLLSELLRVSRRFVIFTYTDRISTHSLSRKLRGHPINPATMSVSQIENVVSKCNGKLENLMTVFRLGSRHRFALIRKL